MVQVAFQAVDGADHPRPPSDAAVALRVESGTATPPVLRAALGRDDCVLEWRRKKDQRPALRREHAEEAAALLQTRVARDQLMIEAYTQWSKIEAKACDARTHGEENFSRLIDGFESKYSWLSRSPDAYSTRLIKGMLDKLVSGEHPSSPLPPAWSGRPVNPKANAALTDALERARRAAALKAERAGRPPRPPTTATQCNPGVGVLRRPTPVRSKQPLVKPLPLGGIRKSSTNLHGKARRVSSPLAACRLALDVAVESEDGENGQACVDALFDEMPEA